MEKFFYQLWYKRRYVICYYLLLPLSLAYYFFWKINDFIYTFFNLGRSLGCPVISVGNITLGGTGKTPFILNLLEMLLKRHKKIVVLSRGYGGQLTGIVEDKDGFSDEVRLLKRRFPEVIILAGKNRLQNYEKYVGIETAPDVVILDDGFQHRKIKRNFDIVMFDGNLLKGNGMLFPAGPLREPLSSVNNRASLIIVKDGGVKSILTLKRCFPAKKILDFSAKQFDIVNLSGNSVDRKTLENKNITAFCGIGNPDSFKNSLFKVSITPRDFIAFSDHINYTPIEIQKIISHGSDYYITTEKDAVKLSNLWYDKSNLLILLPKYELEEDIMETLGIC